MASRTDSNGDYSVILSEPGDYKVQFVDCNDTPSFAAQWWDNQATSATAQPVTVALGHDAAGVDAVLVPGALSTISGKVVNLQGVAMTTGCIVAYLPDQYAIFAPVNPDGSYTVAGLPSGTYALAFVGCNGGDPSPTVADPGIPGIGYQAVWWHGVPLALDQHGNGGPDPIAQGAKLVRVTPGQTLTGYDWCFGCTTISISTITPGIGSLTVAFTTPGLVTDTGSTQSAASTRANDLSYTATCISSAGGAPGSAEGSSSAITVTDLAPGDYTCAVTAADGQVIVASSVVSQVVAVPGAAQQPTALTTTPAAAQASSQPAALAFTGTSTTTRLVPFSVVLICLGLGCIVVARRRRADNTE